MSNPLIRNVTPKFITLISWYNLSKNMFYDDLIYVIVSKEIFIVTTEVALIEI